MNETNSSVVDFASSQVGNQVLRGECWDLGEEALKYAGAKTSNDVMGSRNITKTADYKWGTPILISSVQPGDILQLRNYDYKATNSGGDWRTGGLRPHHTAIVASVYPVIGAKAVMVYEQNVFGSKIVQTNMIYLTSGTSVDGTESVVVSGTVWVYRPIPKP